MYITDVIQNLTSISGIAQVGGRVLQAPEVDTVGLVDGQPVVPSLTEPLQQLCRPELVTPLVHARAVEHVGWGGG